MSSALDDWMFPPKEEKPKSDKPKADKPKDPPKKDPPKKDKPKEPTWEEREAGLLDKIGDVVRKVRDEDTDPPKDDDKDKE